MISADTGSGKSTQIPQFVLDQYITEGHPELCRIIVTQPRRISAVSLAERVAVERGEQLKQSVGYQVRLETVLPEWPGHIMFCTTGILIRYLHHDLTLDGVTHVFLDEVHERSIETDVCMILLRELLKKYVPLFATFPTQFSPTDCRRPDLKIILMSATLQASALAQFFSALFVMLPFVMCGLEILLQ